jgi:hypothetical protein
MSDVKRTAMECLSYYPVFHRNIEVRIASHCSANAVNIQSCVQTLCFRYMKITAECSESSRLYPRYNSSVLHVALALTNSLYTERLDGKHVYTTYSSRYTFRSVNAAVLTDGAAKAVHVPWVKDGCQCRPRSKLLSSPENMGPNARGSKCSRH